MPSTHGARGRLITLVLVGVVASAVGPMLATQPARAADTRTDATGDAGDGPDVISVAAATSADRLTIAVEFATDPPLAWSEAEGYTDSLMIYVGTGPEPPASVESASDVYVFGAHGANVTEPPPFNHIVDGRSGEIEFGIATAEVSGDTITMSVPLSALADPEDVHVLVTAGREGAATGVVDDAFPDDGWASYAVASLGATSGLAIGWEAAVLAVVAFGIALVAVVALLGRRRLTPARPVHTG